MPGRRSIPWSRILHPGRASIHEGARRSLPWCRVHDDPGPACRRRSMAGSLETTANGTSSPPRQVFFSICWRDARRDEPRSARDHPLTSLLGWHQATPAPLHTDQSLCHFISSLSPLLAHRHAAAENLRVISRLSNLAAKPQLYSVVFIPFSVLPSFSYLARSGR